MSKEPTTYDITGMSCAVCVSRVERAVSALDGVTACQVNLLTHSMRVEGEATPDAVIAAVVAAGYGASTANATPTAVAPPRPHYRALVASVCLLLPLLYLSMAHPMWGAPLPRVLCTPVASGLSQLLLCSIVLILNRGFFLRGTQAILHGAPSMDTLVALGSGVAFLYSTVNLCILFAQPDRALPFYYESAAMIVTLIRVGKLLEERAKGKTTSALQGLLSLAPDTAWTERDGARVRVPVAQLAVGDIFLVYPAERIPTDGIILSGEGALDESALTGESLPVDKGVDAQVYAGTHNLSGVLRCRATHVGQDTTLSKIVRAVGDAAASKAPIAKLADRVAAVFVPCVLAIAAMTVLIWLLATERGIGFALARGISVLVISCPCALGLATPVAIMVGSGVGAQNGILYKNATAQELAGRITTVAFDKTGTLTQGKPAVTDLYPIDTTATELLQAALDVEQFSTHPLARAICDYAVAQGLTPTAVAHFCEQAGNGVQATRGEAVLRGGKEAFLQAHLSVSEAARAAAERFSSEGKTPLFFACDRRLLGILAVADTLRTDSVQAIARLHDMGIRTVLLTGDRPSTAHVIASALGIDEVHAQLLPTEKAQILTKLRARGALAMVGDGINDAPALTAADCGIAIGSGTEIAIDAANIVLMRHSPYDVYRALWLGRQVLRNIKQNLFWAFFYNVLGIPLAAGAFIPLLGWELSPMFGAAAMSLSSLFVVTNALRLRTAMKKIPQPKPITQEERKMEEKVFTVEGMMCPHCEARVKAALEALPAIAQAVADHTQNRVTVTLSAPLSDAEILTVIEAQGYRASV